MMVNLLRLSIVVTIYNLQEYIEDCIESILQQESPEIEIILVDDGSVDDSSIICDKYASNPIIKVLHQNNQGVSVARNNGLRIATGEYIYFVDGDDLLDHNAIQSILDKIESSNPDIISGSFVKFNNIEKISSADLTKNVVIRSVETNSGHLALVEMLKNSIFLPNVSTNIFRKALFDIHNISFEPGTTNTEDLSCGISLYLLSDKISVLKRPIYYYRQSRKNSLTHTYSKESIEDTLGFIELWANRIDNLPSDDEVKVWLRDYIAYQYLIALGLIYLYPKKYRKLLINRADKNRSLLNSRLSKKTLAGSYLYSTLGLKNTGRILAFYIKLKKVVL